MYNDFNKNILRTEKQPGDKYIITSFLLLFCLLIIFKFITEYRRKGAKKNKIPFRCFNFYLI